MDALVTYDLVDRAAVIRLGGSEGGGPVADVVDAMNDSLDSAKRDSSVRAVVLTGAGSTFCPEGGLDVAEPLHTYAERMSHGRTLSRVSSILRRLETFPKPVIGAANGAVRGAGLELLLCCDLVIAASSATFAESSVAVGQTPSGGGSVRLPRKISPTRAKYMLLTGQPISAATMMDWGLVNEVVNDRDLMVAVRQLVSELATKSPISLRWMKQLVNDGLDQPLDSALRLEIVAAELNLGSDDMAEGMAAAEDGRPPVFGDMKF